MVLTMVQSEGSAVSLNLEPGEERSILGNIYIGKVKRLFFGAYGAQHEKGCEQTVRYFEKRERESERH